MPKQKSKKQVKNNKNVSSDKEKKLKITISVLVALLVLVLGYCCFSMKGLLISREERRRLEAFESLAFAYIDSNPMSSEENTSVEITDIGLSEDDDLYLDFVIYYYDDNSYGGFLATEYQNGRLHFQCNKEYSRPVTAKGSGHCAFAYSYGEKTVIDNPPEYFGVDIDQIRDIVEYK